MHVRVETPCRPTEDPAKVRTALLNLFPDLQFEREDDLVVGITDSLDRLRDLIRNQKIRDTARSQFQRSRSGDHARIVLSKQAAAVGRVNFGTTSPLGDITVDIEAEDLTTVIDHVAESTVEPAH